VEGLSPLKVNRTQKFADKGLYFVQNKKTPQLNPEEEKFYGVCFSFDNLNHNLIPRNFNSKSGVKTLNMTSAFAVFNRIPLPVGTAFSSHEKKEVTSLPMTCWLPEEEDWNLIKQSHLMYVRRVLSNHFECFQRVRSKLIVEPIHQYTDLSSRQSRYVSCLLNIYFYDLFHDCLVTAAVVSNSHVQILVGSLGGL